MPSPCGRAVPRHVGKPWNASRNLLRPVLPLASSSSLLKFAAYHLTGSIAFYSDALESINNVVTAVAALIGIRMSAKPADSSHPYGHHKAEYFSVVLTGVLIFVASLSILREAYFGVLNPRQLNAPWEGLVVNGLASAIKGAWCGVLIRQGRKHRSPALVADGRHLLTDVVTSGGYWSVCCSSRSPAGRCLIRRSPLWWRSTFSGQAGNC